MLIGKFNKGKMKAINKGTLKCQDLKKQMNEYIEKCSLGNLDKFCGIDPIDYCDKLFNSDDYAWYVKYSMIAKYYERLFILICIIYILIYFGLVYVLNYLISFKMLFYVIALLLGVVLFFIISLNTSKSYSKYYRETIYDLLFCGNMKYTLSNEGLSDSNIKEIIDDSYTSKKVKNRINFSNNEVSGNINDMELKYTKKIKNKKTGNEVSHTSTVFNGFYIKISGNFNRLKGNIINIKEDENIISSLAEDTVKGIYESDLEFDFNSEELNKSFDCSISGYKGFVDADQALMEVRKIITPSFEQHLLYLRKRYNSFNMKISDNYLIASFDMNRSIFQQLKHGELLDFTTTYREANIFVNSLKGKLFGINDFAYYNIFPLVERLFLINYLRYIYYSSFDFNYYYDVSGDVINSFEVKMDNVYNMKNSDFKKIKIDFLKNASEFKKSLNEFKKEG